MRTSNWFGLAGLVIATVGFFGSYIVLEGDLMLTGHVLIERAGLFGRFLVFAPIIGAICLLLWGFRYGDKELLVKEKTRTDD